MNRERAECLAAHEIVAYLDGELPVDRRAEIERHLDECQLCEAAVAGVARLESKEEYLRSADSILTRVRLRTAAPPAKAAGRRPGAHFLPARQYLALAATLVVGVGAAVYLARPGAS